MMIIPTQILTETEKRYRERTEVRENYRNKSPFQADTPIRVEKWVENQMRVPMEERVIGADDLLKVHFLELGLLVSRTVGRVLIQTAEGLNGYGTGFMVSPRLMMTNHHVLETAEQAASSQVEFNYQYGMNGKLLPSYIFDLEPSNFFITNPELDFTLVAVSPQSNNGMGLQQFGWCSLLEQEGKILINQCINIIQQPGGGPKQLSLRENILLDVLEYHLHYQADTAGGSSGSPVFNDQWQVVALHHSGVPKRDNQGNILTKDGLVWTQNMGEEKIAWVANEGVRISRIIKYIKGLNLNGNQLSLRDQLFNQIPPSLRQDTTPVPPDSKRPSESTNGVAIPAHTGNPTWTIPLQVSINLGQPAFHTVMTGFSTPPIVQPSTLPAKNSENRDLDSALAELEAGRTRKYYDKTTDDQYRAAYYRNITPANYDKDRFYLELSELLRRTHKNQPRYSPAKQLYPWIDLQPDRMLKSIYSGVSFEPNELIRRDLRIEAELASLVEKYTSEQAFGEEALVERINLLEEAYAFNCEHVVPQSWFDKQEPMRGDLHHLFACEPKCNSFRSNVPYFDFVDFGETVRGDCGKRLENKFEPGGGKGTVARATLYFLLRYQGKINNAEREYQLDRLDTLLTWHREHPITEYEHHRNMAIYEIQGNRNPLIDFPEWADKINFRLGLG